MDIVVADVPPKYGMLLSRSWGAKLQETMQMDMTYVTIPIFNQTESIYRESHMQYMVTSQERPQNYPLYSVNIGFESFILFNDETFSEQVTLTELMADREEEEDNTEVSKEFARPKKYSKQNTGLELQIIHPLLLNLESQETSPQYDEKHEEIKQIQYSVDLQEQSKSTLDEEDSNQTSEYETNPLWSMHFDGSFTKCCVTSSKKRRK